MNPTGNGSSDPNAEPALQAVRQFQLLQQQQQQQQQQMKISDKDRQKFVDLLFQTLRLSVPNDPEDKLRTAARNVELAVYKINPSKEEYVKNAAQRLKNIKDRMVAINSNAGGTQSPGMGTPPGSGQPQFAIGGQQDAVRPPNAQFANAFLSLNAKRKLQNLPEISYPTFFAALQQQQQQQQQHQQQQQQQQHQLNCGCGLRC
ncbi:hypothetical protein DFJ73DRAFT_14808 [Zopfochytrium polystomum]|nr:hypothetical protein DFJ73DRAFT_14808 [Zopfochytrium polystomum]